MKRIALVGSAPSSLSLAPFDDPSWEIWACSPGAYPHARRVEKWFELHRREPGKPWFSPDYVKFMAGLKCPVMVAEAWPEIPNAQLLPTEDILRKFGPFYFKSSLTWMMALAVMEGATEIGFWGVDMAAQEEWIFQRSTLQCFMWRLQEEPYNVNFTFPPESDLWNPGYLYGIQEVDPHHIKLLKRKEELEQQRAAAQAEMAAGQRKYDFFSGACDDNEYQIKTWVVHPVAREMAINGPSRPTTSTMTAEAAQKIAADIERQMDKSAEYAKELHADLSEAQMGELVPNGHLPVPHRAVE